MTSWQTQNRAACYPPSQIAQLRPSPGWTAQGARPHPLQNMPGAIRPAAPRPPFSTMRPASSQVPRVMSTQRVANTSTQAMGPRPAAAAAAATLVVRTVPQYKYAVGVRNPQQHLNAQPLSCHAAACCSCTRSGAFDCFHVGICPSSRAEANVG